LPKDILFVYCGTLKTKIMIEDRFKGISYGDLSNEQLDSLTKIELLNKILSDGVDTVNGYVKKRIKSILLIHLTILMTIVGLYYHGLNGLYLLTLVSIAIYVDMYFKKSLKWSVISLKTTIALFRGNGDFCTENDHIFEYHIDRLNGVDVGDFYDVEKR